MSLLPTDKITPRAFMEDWLPRAAASLEVAPEDRPTLELQVAIVLRGDEGGEWTVDLSQPVPSVVSGRDASAPVTVIQAVEDWQAALFEGRPPLVADFVERIRHEGEAALPPAGSQPEITDPIRGLSDLRGLIELTIESVDAGDWRVGVLLGEGALPDAPAATIRLGAEQAESMRRGELHPLEALMTGQLRLDGDLGLILQLQAVAMTLSMSLHTGS